MTLAPHILALDLSLVATGWCTNEGTGVIRTKQRGWERVAYILDEVTDRAKGVDVVVIEGYSFGSQGRSVFQIAEFGGIIRNEIWRMKLATVEVSPSTLKKWATGKGNAHKDEMISTAIRRFNFAGTDNNEADAYLLWCMAMQAYGRPVQKPTVNQTEQVAKIDWSGGGT